MTEREVKPVALPDNKVKKYNDKRLAKLQELRKVQVHVASLTRYETQLEGELKSIEMNIDGCIRENIKGGKTEKEALLQMLQEKETGLKEIRERLENG